MFRKCINVTFIFLALALLVLASGCQNGSPNSPASSQAAVTASADSATSTPMPVATTAVPTPTATPIPLALRINGEAVALAEFQVELRQLQEAHQILGKQTPPEEERQQVLDNLIDTVLLAQGAAESSYRVDDAALEAEYNRLAEESGGAQAFSDWIVQQGYTDSTFRDALRRQMAAAWQRDQVVDQVPHDAEQIHARQILTSDENIANQAHELVTRSSVNFAAQAARYDPVTGGDLGWFPRGYLVQPEVEEAAFQLQPGEISPVIHSAIGYHIIQVISREPTRALSPDARRVLQHKALENWVAQRRSASQIEVLVP